MASKFGSGKKKSISSVAERVALALREFQAAGVRRGFNDLVINWQVE